MSRILDQIRITLLFTIREAKQYLNMVLVPAWFLLRTFHERENFFPFLPFRRDTLGLEPGLNRSDPGCYKLNKNMRLMDFSAI